MLMASVFQTFQLYLMYLLLGLLLDYTYSYL